MTTSSFNVYELRSQSTWRLFGLTVITYVVYPVHYLKRQTQILNGSLRPADQISDGFMTANFMFAYLSLGLLVPYFFVEEESLLATFSEIADMVSGILILVWSFKVRNRLNQFLGVKLLGPFMTFFFEFLYINYEINKLCENKTRHDSLPDGDAMDYKAGNEPQGLQ